MALSFALHRRYLLLYEDEEYAETSGGFTCSSGVAAIAMHVSTADSLADDEAKSCGAGSRIDRRN
jgi:hypothetical protein